MKIHRKLIFPIAGILVGAWLWSVAGPPLHAQSRIRSTEPRGGFFIAEEVTARASQAIAEHTAAMRIALNDIADYVYSRPSSRLEEDGVPVEATAEVLDQNEEMINLLTSIQESSSQIVTQLAAISLTLEEVQKKLEQPAAEESPEEAQPTPSPPPSTASPPSPAPTAPSGSVANPGSS